MLLEIIEGIFKLASPQLLPFKFYLEIKDYIRVKKSNQYI